MEMSQSDPVTEWSSSGGQIGLEEPMWQLGLGSGSESYPERPDEADCIYYLRTGFCGYGSRCRFNHPRDRGSVVGAMRASVGEYPERMGQPVCQYYMRTGMCKYGASCKYHHPRQGIGSSSTVALNISGYPLRPTEKECSYYAKTGQCKFGVTCKFHHPQPSGMVPAAPPPAMAAMGQPNWTVPRPPPVLPGSYLTGTYGPMLIPPGMVPFSGWNPYQAPVGVDPPYAMTQLSPSAPSYFSIPSSSGAFSKSQKENVFPERPGEPECQFYMKTGDCKFGSSCRYHHPPEWNVPNTNFALSPMGLPLRPGAPLCTHYAQNGVCKFGPSCKFDHPMGTLSYSPSASSLADMPVAPYPVGSSVTILAPSSSSSELNSAPKKDTMPSASNFSTSTQLSQSTGSSSTTHEANI